MHFSFNRCSIDSYFKKKIQSFFICLLSFPIFFPTLQIEAKQDMHAYVIKTTAVFHTNCMLKKKIKKIKLKQLYFSLLLKKEEKKYTH